MEQAINSTMNPSKTNNLNSNNLPTQPISIAPVAPTPPANNLRKRNKSSAGVSFKQQDSIIVDDSDSDDNYEPQRSHLFETNKISAARSLPPPRAPFLSSRKDQQRRLEDIEEFYLPESEGGLHRGSEEQMSSSLLSGHCFPTRGGVGDGGNDGGIKHLGGDSGGGFMPHSLPTYVDRARVDWRWQERARDVRNERVNSKEVERVGVGVGADVDASSSTGTAIVIDGGGDDHANDGGGNLSALSSSLARSIPSNPPGNLKDDNVDSDKDSLSSSGVGGSRPSVGSLSTSLTAFELLETTRGDLNLDLNREDLQQIASSVQEVNAAMAEAIKDTGVRTEGESTLLARKAENTRAASDEFERDEAVDEIDDELGNFELDDL